MTMTTDMPRCETCRHWQANEDDDSFRSFREGFGLCKGVPFTEDLDSAQHVAEMKAALDADPDGCNAGYLRSRLQRLRPIEDQLAYTADASGYMADLRTRPDFGCVAHKPREE